MPDVGEERMGGVEMPSRKDNPDARLTIGLSIHLYREAVYREAV